MSFSSRIDALLTALADDSSDVVEQQLQFYDVNDIVAVMAKRLLDVEASGGGGSQTLLDLGVVNLVDLLDGPMTLYTPANKFVGEIAYTDLSNPDSQIISIVQAEEPFGNDPRLLIQFPSNGLILPGAIPRGRISSIPLTAGLTTQQSGYFLDEALGAWQANHAYDDKECILAVGHIWSSDPGMSGGSEPDFAGNLGGTVMDGGVLWTDEGPTPTTGSVHLYAQVWSI